MAVKVHFYARYAHPVPGWAGWDAGAGCADSIMPERTVIICKAALGRTGGLPRDKKNKGKNGLAFVAAHPSQRGKDGAPRSVAGMGKANPKGGPPARKDKYPAWVGYPAGIRRLQVHFD